jgi:hypothetical protein
MGLDPPNLAWQFTSVRNNKQVLPITLHTLTHLLHPLSASFEPSCLLQLYSIPTPAAAQIYALRCK